MCFLYSDVRKDAERTAQEFGMKQRKLIEMEESLKDEEGEHQSRKLKLDREEDDFRMRLHDFALRQSDVNNMKSVGTIFSRAFCKSPDISP